ncbi:hypothetical protein AAMO2058_001256400 [Amorphochlora amoebiformis]
MRTLWLAQAVLAATLSQHATLHHRNTFKHHPRYLSQRLLRSSCHSGGNNDLHGALDKPRPGRVSERRRLEVELNGLSRLGQWQRALSTFNRIQELGGGAPTRRELYNSLISSFQLNGPPEQAARIISRMTSEGVPEDANTYQAIANVYAQRKSWETALELLGGYRETVDKPRPEMYSAIIRSCRGGGDVAKKKATEIFASMGRDLVRPTTAVYNALIAAQASPDKALLTLGQMMSTHVARNAQTYASVLGVLAADNRTSAVDEAMSLMQKDRIQPTRQVFESLIKGFSRAKWWHGVAEAWRLAEGSNLNLAESGSKKTKRILLQASLQTNNWEVGLALFKSFEEPPGLRLSVAMIVSLSANRNCEEALRLLAVLNPRADGAKDIAFLGLKALNALLAAAMRESNWEIALKALESAAVIGVEPDENSYASAITTCARGSRFEEACGLLSKMRASKLTINARAYNPVVYAAPSLEKAEEIVAEMKNGNPSIPAPNEVTYVSLITAAARLKDSQAARRWFDEAASSTSYQPLSPYAWNALMSAYLRTSDSEKATELIREMISSGASPDIRTYTAACGACEGEGAWETALDLLEEMHKHELPVGTRTYQTVIRVVNKAGQWDSVLSLYNDLRGRDIIPSANVYSQVIDAACNLGDVDTALRLHNTAERAGKYPSQHSVYSLLNLLSHKKMTTEVIDIMQTAVSRGLTGPPSAYRTVLNHLKSETKPPRNGPDDTVGMVAQIHEMQKDVVINQIEIPAGISRSEMLDQIVRWARLEVSQNLSGDVTSVVRPLSRENGEYRGFTLEIGQTKVECVIDDRIVPNVGSMSNGRSETLRDLTATTVGKFFEIRRRRSETVTEESRTLLKRFLKSLSLAITNYIAFGSVFADH